MVVHSSGVSSSSWVFAVFPDTAVAGAHVAPALPGLLESSRHCWQVDGGGGRAGRVRVLLYLKVKNWKVGRGF